MLFTHNKKYECLYFMIAWTAAEPDGTAGAVWTLGFLLLCLLLSS